MTPDQRAQVAELMAQGVPWPAAIEAVASTALDRDDHDGHTIVVDTPPTKESRP